MDDGVCMQCPQLAARIKRERGLLHRNLLTFMVRRRCHTVCVVGEWRVPYRLLVVRRVLLSVFVATYWLLLLLLLLLVLHSVFVIVPVKEEKEVTFFYEENLFRRWFWLILSGAFGCCTTVGLNRRSEQNGAVIPYKNRIPLAGYTPRQLGGNINVS